MYRLKINKIAKKKSEKRNNRLIHHLCGNNILSLAIEFLFIRHGMKKYSGLCNDMRTKLKWAKQTNNKRYKSLSFIQFTKVLAYLSYIIACQNACIRLFTSMFGFWLLIQPAATPTKNSSCQNEVAHAKIDDGYWNKQLNLNIRAIKLKVLPLIWRGYQNKQRHATASTHIHTHNTKYDLSKLKHVNQIYFEFWFEFALQHFSLQNTQPHTEKEKRARVM